MQRQTEVYFFLSELTIVKTIGNCFVLFSYLCVCVTTLACAHGGQQRASDLELVPDC